MSMCIRNPEQAHGEPQPPPKIGFVRVGGRYRVGKLLGSGGSGCVYLGRDIRTGAEVALKIGITGHSPSRLSHEYNVYMSITGSTGTSSVLWYGKEGPYEVIVLEQLGNSLSDLINKEQLECGRVFSYASQMLSAVASLHDRHYIHRDIKPSNFIVHTGADTAASTIFLIDFGLARQYRNPMTYLHTPCAPKQSIIGTLPFTSVNGQHGRAQSRRDDLESLAYTIVFLARGDLPWSTFSFSRDHEAVLQKKVSITAEELCKGLPPHFSKFIIHIRSLRFDEKPDYEYLHTILSQCSGTGTHQLSKAPPSAPPSLSAKRTPAIPSPSDRVLRSSRTGPQAPRYLLRTRTSTKGLKNGD